MPKSQEPTPLGGPPAPGLLAWMRKAFAGLLRPARPPRPAPEVPPLVRPYPWEASYPANVSWDLEVEPKALFTLLDDAVAAYPDNPCLIFFGKRYSYKEVGQLVDKAARGFQDLGVGKGVKVGLFLPNSPYYIFCYHAILKVGGTVVNYNPLYAEREVARQIRESDTRIMVTMDLEGVYAKIAPRLEDTDLEKIVVCQMSGALPFTGKALFTLFKRKEVASIPQDRQHIRFEHLITQEDDYQPVEIDPLRDIAVLQFTGGTTGIPKGAKLTHANLYTNAVQTRMWAADIEPGREKAVAVLPLFHVFGMTAAMNVSLYCGCEIILMPRFKVTELLKVIDKYHPTVLYGVPTLYSAINSYGELDEYDISSLKYCISGGAALPLEIKETFESLTGCTLVEGYGLTEAGPVCTVNPFTGINKPGSAGLPIPGTIVEIVSLEDPDRRLPAGERGEICITGPQVMAGYAKQEAETAEVLRGGRLHTGDVGYMDADGYVYIIDRIKDLIITGGFNVYPRMVEEAIYLHSAVAEVAVCGVPSKHRGEIIKAYVIVKEGAELSVAELKEFLKDKLAPFEQPRQIAFVEEIPKTLIGKPLRRELVAAEIRKLKEEGNGAADDLTPADWDGDGDDEDTAADAAPAKRHGKGGFAA